MAEEEATEFGDVFIDSLFEEGGTKVTQKKEEKVVRITKPGEKMAQKIEGHIPIESTPFRLPRELLEGPDYKGKRLINFAISHKGVPHTIFWPSDKAVPVDADKPSEWQNNITLDHVVQILRKGTETHIKNMLPIAKKKGGSFQPINKKHYPRIFSYIDKMLAEALETGEDPPVDERGFLQVYAPEENEPEDEKATMRIKTWAIPIGPYEYWMERLEKYEAAKAKKQQEEAAKAKKRQEEEAKAAAEAKKQQAEKATSSSQRDTQKRYKQLSPEWKGDKTTYQEEEEEEEKRDNSNKKKKKLDPMEELEAEMAPEEEEEEEDESYEMGKSDDDDDDDDDEDEEEEEEKDKKQEEQEEEDEEEEQDELMESEEDEEEDEEDEEEEECGLKDMKQREEVTVGEGFAAFKQKFKMPDSNENPNKPARRTKTVDLKKKTPSEPVAKQQTNGGKMKKREEEKKNSPKKGEQPKTVKKQQQQKKKSGKAMKVDEVEKKTKKKKRKQPDEEEEEEEEARPAKSKKRKTEEEEEEEDGYGPRKAKFWINIMMPYLRKLWQQFHEKKGGKPMPDPFHGLTDIEMLEHPSNETEEGFRMRAQLIACVLENFCPKSSSWNIRRDSPQPPPSVKKPAPKKPKNPLAMDCFDDMN